MTRRQLLAVLGLAVLAPLARAVDQATVDRAYAAERAWRNAVAAVRVGMTRAELEKLHPGLVYGGEIRTLERADGVHEWHRFPEERVTVYLVNGRVSAVQR